MPFNPKAKDTYKPIFEYIHSGNKVIQPTAIDLVTGVLTTATKLITDLGLVAGTKYGVMPAMNYFKNNCIPREWNPVNYMNIEPIDDYTFYCWNGTTTRIASYPDANNSAVLIDSVRFEIPQTITQFDISGLGITKGRWELNAQRNRNGYSYVQLSTQHESVPSVSQPYNYTHGIFLDGRDFLSLYAAGSFEKFLIDTPSKLSIVNMNVDKLISTVWNNSSGQWTATNNAVTGTGLQLVVKNPTFIKLFPYFQLCNGSVFRIYKDR